ncbi:MAG: hypothetical protein VX422_01800 [Candidatus Thermoplasmatota archaeon]|nr:hypothetical protein [Euryarchaeota archaeon]MEC7059230.1 hypothetical protein [Candidatus Thermoplasmatota archaeon]MEC7064881.1 hypothetical protein [Candidatus Thermoplasmatota archaeon]MEC7443904.1 hypothetical protein [Candidatus Thermoplasmatota archaeon]MEC7625658.1 hypothetical protein [Candidatus Thermoplasmatota archaeon]
MESQLQELLWGAGILALPLLLALPMRLAWQFWVGVGHEVSEYRTVVRQIVDSGHQVSSFSQTLDDIARNLRIPPAKQRLIEAELLHPLTLSHFLLLPALLILPLSAIMALPLILIGFPFMLFMEYLLIRQRLLILALKSIERLMHWQVIHIPKPHRGNKEQRRSLTEFSQHIEHFNYVPQAAFLGLFAWLIVHWVLDLDSWTVELIVSSLLYMVLLSILSVLNTAFEADLVFVDPAKGRLVPVNQWLEGVLNPVVGIGLLFLLGRNLLEESRDVDGNPILFATVVLTLLYGAAIVGISYRWGYSSWRGERVRQDFEVQVIEYLNPLSYDLTRTKGRIDFNVRMGMDERLTAFDVAAPQQLSFEELQNLPSIPLDTKAPDNPLSK